MLSSRTGKFSGKILQETDMYNEPQEVMKI